MFTQSIEIRPLVGGTWGTVDAVVDLDAPYSWIPRDILAGLGIESDESRDFVSLDGARHPYDIAEVRMRFAGHDGFSICVFGASGTQPRLGRVTLDGFGLTPDADGGRLVPIKVFPMPSFFLVSD